MKRLLSVAAAAVLIGASAFGGLALAGDSSPESPVTVRSKVVTVRSSAFEYVKSTFSVSCEEGEGAIGGGYSTSAFLWSLGSHPDPTLTKWTVVLTSEHVGKRTATVYAVCLKPGAQVPGADGTTPG